MAPQEDRTPFDQALDQTPAAPVNSPTTQADGTSSDNTLHLLLTALWDMPRANQMALSAVGGALAVIIVSGIVGHFVPHLPTNQHSIATVSHANQLKEPSGNNVADGTVVKVPFQNPNNSAPVVQTEVVQPSSVDYTAPSVSSAPMSDTNSTQPLTEEDRKRLEERRREDQIVAEKRLLESKKKAIEREIEDKQLEEQRAAEDKKRMEDREAEDKKIADDRQQEEKRKIEDEQRKLDDEQHKLAEAH
ncbi:MAG: hypothetical protein JO316_18685 [Abitibacteriaceae bacterium]|nr:hypothetical protein [Abditibacteriaceae bacterium]MBV9867389.1 hypothetical protein [Abditibacteriaceae bacterium]